VDRLVADAGAREDQIKADQEVRWTLSAWLSWLDAEEDRMWFWWDARITGERQARVIVEIPDWPPPLGALQWLLRAAGADKVLIDELAKP
jgi:hypothetical protein